MPPTNLRDLREHCFISLETVHWQLNTLSQRAPQSFYSKVIGQSDSHGHIDFNEEGKDFSHAPWKRETLVSSSKVFHRNKPNILVTYTKKIFSCRSVRLVSIAVAALVCVCLHTCPCVGVCAPACACVFSSELFLVIWRPGPLVLFGSTLSQSFHSGIGLGGKVKTAHRKILWPGVGSSDIFSIYILLTKMQSFGHPKCGRS